MRDLRKIVAADRSKSRAPCAIPTTPSQTEQSRGFPLTSKGCSLKPAIVVLVEFDDCGDYRTCSDKSIMINFQEHIEHIPSLMKAAELRHQVLSQNLANVNTPGYQRLDVDFETHLARIMSGESPGSDFKPRVIEDNSASVRADGNNVNVDTEIGELGKNAILYQMYTELLNSQFRQMQQAVEMP